MPSRTGYSQRPQAETSAASNGASSLCPEASASSPLRTESLSAASVSAPARSSPPPVLGHRNSNRKLSSTAFIGAAAGPRPLAEPDPSLTDRADDSAAAAAPTSRSREAGRELQWLPPRTSNRSAGNGIASPETEKCKADTRVSVQWRAISLETFYGQPADLAHHGMQPIASRGA